MHLGDSCLETVEGVLYRPTIGSWYPWQRPLNAGLLQLFEDVWVGGRVRHMYLDRAVSAGSAVPWPGRRGRAARSWGTTPSLEGQNAVQDPRSVAADENRGVRTLSRLGPGPDGTERNELAMEAGFILCPDHLHGFDALGDNLHANRRVGAMVRHFLAVPPRTDTEVDPAAGKVVDAGYLFSGDYRVAAR